jgi:hypothetical protein
VKVADWYSCGVVEACPPVTATELFHVMKCYWHDANDDLRAFSWHKTRLTRPPREVREAVLSKAILYCVVVFLSMSIGFFCMVYN